VDDRAEESMEIRRRGAGGKKNAAVSYVRARRWRDGKTNCRIPKIVSVSASPAPSASPDHFQRTQCFFRFDVIL
jgi:hypothetical protein